MEKIKHLVKGEFTRLAKYNLFTASFAVALIWIVMGYFLEPEEFNLFIPLVFLMESSAMTALLVGAQMFYEKKEHTISSILISPISSLDYIISKILTHTVNILIIFFVIVGSLFFLKDMTFNYVPLLIATVLVTAFYVAIGLLLSYVSRDFTALLLNYMLMMIVFVFPSLLIMMGVFPAEWKEVLYYLPTEATIRMMNMAVEEVKWGQFFYDSAYIIVLIYVSFRYLVIPRFKSYATANLGV